MRHSRQEKFLENFWRPENSGQEKFLDVEQSSNFQEKIKSKKIVLVGCGGIGSVLAELLIRGGFLNLTLIDNDIIDETNLQRQTFFEEDIGNSKTKALKKHLQKIDKNSKITSKLDLLSKKNIDETCKDADLIIDATDNFETRKLINEYCEKNNKDWLYNGAIKSQIITCLFRGEDRMFSKVFPKNIKNIRCCDVGVLASTTFSSASLAYNQILKYFLEVKENKLIKLDLWTNMISEVNLK